MGIYKRYKKSYGKRKYPKGIITQAKRYNYLRNTYKGYMAWSKPRSLSFIVPPTMRTKLRYTQEILLNPTITACVGNVFSANGCYDPDVSGSGTQPRGYDQLCSAGGLYSAYIVLGSKITVNFISQASDVTGITHVGVSLRTSSTFSSGPETQLSDRYTKRKVLTGINSKTATIVRNTYSPHSFLGVKDVQDEGDLRGAYNSNPSRQSYYTVWACPTNTGLVEPVTLVALVQIDYIVLLVNPVSIGTS